MCAFILPPHYLLEPNFHPYVRQTSKLNAHLNGYMKGLTAKVFRTFNASHTFQVQLEEKTPHNGTVQEKLNAYNEANRMVAILCNHQRSVPKTHEQSMARMNDKACPHKLVSICLILTNGA